MTQTFRKPGNHLGAIKEKSLEASISRVLRDGGSAQTVLVLYIARRDCAAAHGLKCVFRKVETDSFSVL